MPLSDAACRGAKPEAKLRKLSDGKGLQLWVQPNGSRLWRLAYRFGGRQKLLSLGSYPEVSLAEARTTRDEARKLLRNRIDPSAAKKAARLATTNKVAFQEIAQAYLEKLKLQGRASATIAKAVWVFGLVDHKLGSMAASEIRPADVLDAVTAIQKRGCYETANRTRATIGAAFRYAIAKGHALTDPTTALRGALIRPKKRPHPAITDARELGAMLRAIYGYKGHPTTIAALKLIPLLFTRPGEMRAAEWLEFDMQRHVWTVPATKTKMRRPLQVPLSRQALSILGEVQRLGLSSKYVFPSIRCMSKPMSENTLNAALRAMGYDKDTATAHGFRATASTILNESNLWNADAIERQLGHVEANAVRAAYQRGQHGPERVEMMQWWANYLDELRLTNGIAQAA